MIKKTSFILGMIILSLMLYIAYINKATIFSVNYLKGSAEFNVLTLVIVVTLLSALITSLILQGSILEIEKNVKKQTRQTEKAGIAKDEAQDRIKLLEAKIQTLEKALSDVLKKD